MYLPCCAAAKMGNLGCLWPLSWDLITSAAKGIQLKCCVLHTVPNFTSPIPSYRPMVKNCAKVSTRHPWPALAVPDVLCKGWEAASPITNLERKKNGKKKPSKNHEIPTMGVINAVLNINKELECSPLVLKCCKGPETSLKQAQVCITALLCRRACCLIPPQKTSSILMVQKLERSKVSTHAILQRGKIKKF